jgi:hypothetical protein
MIKFLKSAFVSQASITAKLDAEFAAKKAATPVLMDEELGLPYGDPYTAERAAWILADEERQDRQDRALEEYLRNI